MNYVDESFYERNHEDMKTRDVNNRVYPVEFTTTQGAASDCLRDNCPEGTRAICFVLESPTFLPSKF